MPVENVNDRINWEKLKFLIFLYTDIRKLADSLLSFLEIIKTRLDPMPQPEILEKCLSESKSFLEIKLPQIQKIIVCQISADSIVHLKQLNDIPRLFRKTNREIPTKPCGYVTTLLKCPNEFRSAYQHTIGEESMITWLEDIFSFISAQ